MSDRWKLALAAFLVVLAGGIPRILLAAGTLPDALRPFVWSDALFVYERGLSGHRLPYVDTPFEYPPLTGAISGLFSLLASGPLLFVAAWVVLAAACAALTAAMLGAWSGERAWRAWVFTPQLLLLGTVNFDLLAVMFMTAAVAAARARRSWLASLALALGTAAKLYPAASTPPVIARAGRWIVAGAIFVGALALCYLPTTFQRFSSAGGVGFYAVGIAANPDSVWGIVERTLTGLGVTSAGAIVVGITLTGLAFTYLAFVLPRMLRSTDVAAATCLATVTLLLWSRLYSPQYSLWVLPAFALLGVRGSLLPLLAFADVMVFATIYPLTLVKWAPGDLAPALLLAGLATGVVLRHAALWRLWRVAWRATGEQSVA